jgi:hypothetical protein
MNEYIIRLEVAVDYSTFMDVRQSIKDLTEQTPGPVNIII